MNKTAIFAAGCFWGIEERFRKLDGVIETSVGYSGGDTDTPSYQQVCSGATGHAEAVKVVYDDEKLSYKELVKFFFEIHDPTTKDRQGADVGTQYRSAIFYIDEEQKKIAEEVKSEVPRAVTEITKASDFNDAEDYHQKYIAKQHGEF